MGNQKNCLNKKPGFMQVRVCREQIEFHETYTSIYDHGVMMHVKFCAECSGSVGRALDWGSKGCWFEPHGQQSHCVVSLNKSHYRLLSTGPTQEDPSRHD